MVAKKGRHGELVPGGQKTPFPMSKFTQIVSWGKFKVNLTRKRIKLMQNIERGFCIENFPLKIIMKQCPCGGDGGAKNKRESQKSQSEDNARRQKITNHCTDNDHHRSTWHAACFVVFPRAHSPLFDVTTTTLGKFLSIEGGC